jgi:FtsP/CotA-like multicopper oxidase with cupredoxin domain
MSYLTSTSKPWAFVAAVAALLPLVAAVAWSAGRSGVADSRPQAAQESTGYDLGEARKPAANGQMREFTLVSKEAEWEIAPGVTVPAITYNGQVPGPLIRVAEGDTLRVTLENELSQATSIHWHGLHVPNNMDSVPPFTQAPIEPGWTTTTSPSTAERSRMRQPGQ